MVHLGCTLGAVAGQLQLVSQDLKTVRLGAHASDLGLIQTAGNIGDASARKTPGVMMRIASAAISGRSVSVGELLGEAARYQGLEALVHGGQRYTRHVTPNRQKDFVGRRVIRRFRDVPKNRGALPSEAVSTLPESPPKD